MRAELWRGPLDGSIHDIPENTKLWVVKAGPNIDNIMRMSEADIPYPTVEVDYSEYAYACTDRFGTESGARIFEYVGERVKK